MEIRLIIAQYAGYDLDRYMPNVIDAWDEYTLEDNWERYAEKLAAEQAKVPKDYAAVRELVVKVPDSVVVGLFQAPTVIAEVKS